MGLKARGKITPDMFSGGAGISPDGSGYSPLYEALKALETVSMKEVHRFYISGGHSLGTSVGGRLTAPRAGRVVSVRASADSMGSADAGNLIVDVNVGGTTIFTDQDDRPSVAFDEASKTNKSTLASGGEFVEGDALTVDVDAVPTGGPPAGSGITVEVEVEYDNE